MNKTFTDLHDQALTMGEHIEQMREAHEAVVRERDALAAYSKRLANAFTPFMSKGQIAVDGFVLVPQDTYNAWILALNEAPSESLNRINAQVEEETIERAEEETGYVLESVSRKYAKQAGPTVEEE